MIDTTKLRELAMAATTGEWLVERYGTGMHEIYINISESETETVIGIPPDGSSVPLICSADAEYIAAANPATVLALLDEIDRLRADKDHVTSMFESTQKQLNKAIEIIDKQRVLVDRLLRVEAAALNLAKVKGRHHSELAMNKLLESLK